jgi:hypothetical protein
LSPSDYHQFPAMEQNLGDHKYNRLQGASNCETMPANKVNRLLLTGNRKAQFTISLSAATGSHSKRCWQYSTSNTTHLFIIIAVTPHKIFPMLNHNHNWLVKIIHQTIPFPFTDNKMSLVTASQ